MTPRAWVRLDNASNIFLAARSAADPKVFRLSAEMDHEVDPRDLQRALDTIYDRYRLYHAVLRAGVFWYYLQDSDLQPEVTAEDLQTCAPIYQEGRRNLLFRVMHHRRRIVLEVFHALADGTGALWFLTDLVTEYVRTRTAQADPDDDATLTGPPPGTPVPHDPEDTAHALTTDSFVHHFRRRRKRRPRRSKDPWAVAEFEREATSPALAVADPEAASGAPRQDEPTAAPARTVHRMRGTRTPDNRTRAVELTLPSRQLLDLAREIGVSPTMYLTGVFFEAVRRSAGDLRSAPTLTASVPVNLRQFFPSTSARNFFATIRVGHTYGAGGDDLASVCRELETQFRPQVTPQALETSVRRFIRLERNPLLRVVPRPLKNVSLWLLNWHNNRGLTIAVSNLGRVSLPEGVDDHVGRMGFHVSAVRPQLCAMSHAEQLTLTFTSPFIQTTHIREVARLLTEQGAEVTVAAARVTEAEIARAEAELPESASRPAGGAS